MKISNTIFDLLNRLHSHDVVKEISIKRLLISWAFACSIMLLILTVAIIFLINSIFTSQERLLEETLPIENVNKNIIKTVNEYISRKSDILTSKSSKDLQQHIDRRQLNQNFLRDLNFLSQFADEHSSINKIHGELHSSFDLFDKNDKLMTEKKFKILVNNEITEEKILELEIIVNRIQNHVDEISGKLDLERSIEKKKLRTLIKDNKNDERLLYKLLERNLSLTDTDEKIIINQIQVNVGNIIQLARKIIYEDNRDILISIQENQIVQEKNSLLHNLNALEKVLTGKENLLLLIQKIKNDNQKLIGLLLESKDSILNLRMEGILLNEELDKSIIQINHSINKMKVNIDDLSLITTQFVSQINNKFHRDLENITYIVVIISVVLLFFIVTGITHVLFRINRPLENLRNAMSNLSNGILTTRLDTKVFARDEFISIANDFNYFAHRNQRLIEELSDAKQVLAESEQRTRAIVENALVGIAHLIDRQFISVNQRFEEMFGYDRDEIKGLYTEILFDSTEAYEAIGQASYPLMKVGKTYKGEWRVKRKDGSYFWCAISAKTVETFSPEKGTIWLYEDITQQKNSADQLKQMANFDTLTNLPNRSLFMDRLRNNIARAKRNRELLAILFIDLDRFKQVNDSLGHDAGDKLLQGIAQRLTESVRASDTVARLGGDEFVILLTAFHDSDIAGKHAQKVINILSKPVLVNNQEIIISPSIGISLFPNDGYDEIQLLKNADSAMYHAKSAGRNNYQFYTEEMNDRALHRLTLERKLRQAAENNDFMVYFQPFVKTQGQQIVGYEALLRWRNENKEMVPPVEFIPILEETGLIKTVGEWVIERSCKNIKMINDSLGSDYRVSINLSARQFQQIDIVKNIENILIRTKLHPSYVDVEITETLLMEGLEKNKRTLFALHELGVHISLDDFGTGYSSLAYLKQFPIDKLKIDKSFVRDILHDPSDAAICEAILAMANSLDIEVIAEGVETYEQLNYLAERSCHYAQGYLFGKPEPIKTIMIVNNDAKNVS